MTEISPQTKWNRAHRDAIHAHGKVRTAIRQGRLKPKPCIICGAKAEAHHPDHAEVLVVEWLCRFHHRRLHSKGEGDLFAFGAD